MSFRYVEVEIPEGTDGSELLEEYAKLVKIHEENSDEADHGHSMVCQIFACKDSGKRFFLSGRLLNKEESDGLAKLLGCERRRIDP